MGEYPVQSWMYQHGHLWACLVRVRPRFGVNVLEIASYTLQDWSSSEGSDFDSNLT